jgi:hypothetical protein
MSENKTLDSILKTNYGVNIKPQNTNDKAKQELKQLFIELIGDDEQYRVEEDRSNVHDEILYGGRNKLRAELRKSVESL